MKLITPQIAQYLIGDVLEYAYGIVTQCHERRPLPSPRAVEASPDLQINELQMAAEALNQNFKIEQANPLSADLIAIDEQRDRLIIGFRTSLEGLTYHFDPAAAAAATLLLGAVDKYGSRIAKMHYEIETASINSLLDDITGNAPLTNALAMLKLEPWVAQMRNTNDGFRQIYSSRIGSKTDNVRTSTVELRKNLNQALRNLFTHLTAHATLSNDATIPVIMSDINNLTERYNQLVKSRLARLQKTTAQTTETDTYQGV